tara:strand:- start:318 stop:617 length:300 start_codon:yes stop_codon:yes gene_type:complete
MSENQKNSGFSVSVREDIAGFRLFFENGYGISVIFGGDSGSQVMKTIKTPERHEYFCDTAEVAVLNPNGELVPFRSEGAVKSFCTPEELPKIISWTMNK